MPFRTNQYVKEALTDLKKNTGSTINYHVNNAVKLYLTLINQTPELDLMLNKLDQAINRKELDPQTLWSFKARQG